MQRLAHFLNVDVKDIIDIIEVDLSGEAIVIENENCFNAIESLTKKA